MKKPLSKFLVVFFLETSPAHAEGHFTQAAVTVDVYDFLDVTLELSKPPPGNPFIDASLTGEFSPRGEPPLKVDGFCDSAAGKYEVEQFNPRTGELTSLPEAAGPAEWKSPAMPEGEDWVFLARSK